MIKVLPSSNPCPDSRLNDYIKSLEDLGVEYLHCDVMDGEFVENKCLDFDVLNNVRNNSNILLDVHLMVSNVYKNVKLYAKLKPNIITIHYEALKNTREFFKVKKFLQHKQILMGLAINPDTPIDIVRRLIAQVDLILIMTVVPGKSGQALLPECLSKIQLAKELCQNEDIIIEVDGGINETNFKEIAQRGGDFLVMGSAFFKCQDKKDLLIKVDKHYNNNNNSRI